MLRAVIHTSGANLVADQPGGQAPSCPESHSLVKAFMRYGSTPLMVRRPARFAALSIALAFTLIRAVPLRAEPSAARMTPIVRAVRAARPSVVNIQGPKTVRDSEQFGASEGTRRVNGMGTGVVVDGRGYIITNFHVIDGVREIRVTLADGDTYLAEPVSHDMETDLAIIKIHTDSEVPVVRVGTSSDLMTGEPVIAVGNAYGYQHTVTRGVISALHRTVQISETQTYDELIQTDASINPGNSGGPLLNVDGEMIGINVAVRSGAQGIGFAIPVDKVMTVSANLMSVRRLEDKWHGLVFDEKGGHSPRIVVRQVEPESPAARSGVRPGDEIAQVGSQAVHRSLDFERALLGRPMGDQIPLVVRRNSKSVPLDLVLASAPRAGHVVNDRAWELLGIRLAAVPAAQRGERLGRYRGGLLVTDVRPQGPAAGEGIRPGDVLVGMHIWETVSMENVAYVLNRPDFVSLQPLKFYVVRGDRTYFGHLSVAHHKPR